MGKCNFSGSWFEPSGKTCRVGAEFMGKRILMGISRNQRREDLWVAEKFMRKCIFSQG